MITDEARRWADREYPAFEFLVTAREIQKYSHAIGETDPVHFEPAAARAAGYADVIAPALFPYVIRMHAANLAAREELEPDGSASADVPPLPTKRAMAGEISLELGVPVVAGDVITVSKRLIDMYEKEGRSGPLVFVQHEFRFQNQRGEVVATEAFTRIYR